MHDVSLTPAVERRRSQRVCESVPVLVRGIDLLGHPFEERTATLTLNLQGCRYFSKHHLPRNSWISIEVGEGGERRNVRARVAWIHRPHSIRDLFQVAVELETAADIWGLQNAPENWANLPQPHEANPQTEAVAPLNLEMEGPSISMTSYPFDSASNFERPFGASSGAHGADFKDQASEIWREKLASEMDVAQRQWDELLQSSIDRTLQRLAEQLPERAQEAARASELRMAEQVAGLGQAMAQMSADAQNTVAAVKASVEQEIWRARDTIENTRQQILDRLAAEAEARIAPHAARIPELLRELSGREEQVAESLRLHRERLRHASDNALREVVSQAEATTGGVRTDFETARVEALARWNEELETLSARAGHAAGESIGRTAEWLQQETRERLQLLAEQTLATATANLQEESSKATNLFATHLEGQSIFHLAHVHQELDGVANDLTGRARTQLAEAAEAAASSFGQVLHDISATHVEQFNQASEGAFERKRQEIEGYSRQVRADFERDSAGTAQNLRDQATSHIESVRANLAAESAAALDAHRVERETHAKQWSEDLGRVAEETVAQCNGRIQTAADAWTVASVRRLNEHGQNIIESLMRSADQALRNSASKIFEGLAVALREQGLSSVEGANASGAAAGANLSFSPNANPSSPQEGQSNEMPLPPQESNSWQAGA